MNSGSSSSNDGVDGFSRLGFDLLVTMLCLLPFKECVRNSVLSKQWQFLWFGCKNIELDETNFVKVEDNPVARQAHRRDFITFVRRWMDNFNNDGIETLILRVSNPCEYTEDINRCISLALSKGVKSLSIDFTNPFSERRYRNQDAVFDLPPQAYHQTGLYSLKLFKCRFDLSKFEDQILRGLKELSLGHMSLTDETVSTINADVCSSLKILSLTRCRNINNVQLRGPNVETLVIDRCDADMFLVTPNIRVFKYCGEAGGYENGFGYALQEVELEIDDDFDLACGDLLYNMMIQLDCVRTMTVCSYILQVIPTGEECIGMGVPLDVRQLTLNTSAQEAELWGISFFLNSCPFLETLIIQIVPPKYLPGYEPPFRSLHCFYPPNPYHSQCILRTLKVIQVKGFKATRGEMYVLKHLIKYGRVLQEISVYFSPEVGSQYPRSVATLMAVPRASPRLHIMTYY